MRLGLRGQVGDQGRDHVARSHADLGQQGGKAGAAVMVLGIGDAVVTVDHRGLPGKDLCRPAQMRQWR